MPKSGIGGTCRVFQMANASIGGVFGFFFVLRDSYIYMSRQIYVAMPDDFL
jgi:hypothetical protein